ncbi:MAG: DUF2189 domain-containing protein [Methyloligellaceae bacterium]
MTVSHSAASPMPTIRQVGFDAPWGWLAAGWRDLWRAPQISLLYGAAFAFAAFVLLFGLTQFGWQALVLALAGGFLLVGPMLAVGLYEASRRLGSGEAIHFKDIVLVGVKSPGQLAFLGVILMLAYFVWLEIAFLLFMLFFGQTGLPPAQDFVATLLFTGRGLGLLVIGSTAGAALAATVFTISAVSVPLLMVERIDVVSAIVTSFKAVAQNAGAMVLWAVLIAALIAVGVATAFVGLVITFPLVGHATWHAFTELVEREGTSAAD